MFLNLKSQIEAIGPSTPQSKKPHKQTKTPSAHLMLHLLEKITNIYQYWSKFF